MLDVNWDNNYAAYLTIESQHFFFPFHIEHVPKWLTFTYLKKMKDQNKSSRN